MIPSDGHLEACMSLFWTGQLYTVSQSKSRLGPSVLTNVGDRHLILTY